MSRFREGDDDYENCQLDFGRWEHNSRQALKGKRGRQALRELRDALVALPEHKLISSAVCTVGGADQRAPLMTDAEFDQYAVKAAGWMAEGADLGPDWPQQQARYERIGREERHDDLARSIAADGCEGVCGVGALLWHRLVKGGMDPAEAFAALPTLDVVDDGDGGDPLHETAELAKRDAGLTYTLAWNLAYRNDETYRQMTPEERWQAFVDWIDTELAETAAA